MSRTAIISNNQKYSYEELQAASNEMAQQLLGTQSDLNEMRVAFMVEPGFDYVRVQWGIWKAGGVAVPLCVSYPLASLQYVIEDTQAEIIVASPVFENILKEYAKEKNLVGWSVSRLVGWSKSFDQPTNRLTDQPTKNAMILYTSGTTNLPKGVVTTHANIDAQVHSLLNAWQYSEKDHTLCVLPLHHVHGIINVITCTLRAGGTVEFLSEFSPENIFVAFERKKINVFMAVPTIYFKLIAYFETLPPARQKKLSAVMKKFRLMVSGSAALPVSVMEKWEKISGHRLLERYGMTELGMAISNPYIGERKAGYIGQPLPGVTVRLVNDTDELISNDEPGEIQVRGANVFKEYWRKPEATIATFTHEGWFKTGDVAVLEDGYYRILGRSSIDIIKSGGYKISALEIEEVLRTHPEIKDCSVVGIEDEEWGELVAAALITDNKFLDTKTLNTWIREKMPAYKVPRRYVIIDELPRNAMGKVVKNELKKI